MQNLFTKPDSKKCFSQNLFTKPSDSKKCFSQNLFAKPSDSSLYAFSLYCNAEDDFDRKINSYLFFVRILRMVGCVYRLSAPHLNFSITSVSSVELQRETLILICRWVFHYQTTQILVIPRCCFAEAEKSTKF